MLSDIQSRRLKGNHANTSSDANGNVLVSNGGTCDFDGYSSFATTSMDRRNSMNALPPPPYPPQYSMTASYNQYASLSHEMTSAAQSTYLGGYTDPKSFW